MTIKIIRKIKFGNGFGVIAEFTGDKKAGSDTGYPTGGYSIMPSQLGLHTIENVLAQSPASSRLWEYDLANNKLKILKVNSTSGALEEVANESDQSEAVTRIVAFGW
jgi:hypothetical protein